MLPVATRANKRKAALKKVLEDVLELQDTNLIYKALDYNGLMSIQAIVSISDSNINTLQYEDGNDSPILPLHSRNLLRILKAWNTYLIDQYGVKKVDWE